MNITDNVTTKNKTSSHYKIFSNVIPNENQKNEIPGNSTNEIHHVVTTTNITTVEYNKTLPAQTTSDQFVTIWKTKNRGEDIRLPLIASGNYNFTVDWSDGYQNTITSYNDNGKIHQYTSKGEHTVVITGLLEGWNFQYFNHKDKTKFFNILQWGNMKLGNDGSYFMGAENMVISAEDSPDLNGTIDLSSTFRSTNVGIAGNLDAWDVSSVTNMSFMFYNATSFNQLLSDWNTSSVTDMSNMFAYDWSFNQSLSDWDVSHVTDMSKMFSGANFNQPLNSWDVSSVTDMSWMFSGANFNQPLNSWDVSSVTDMNYMFAYDWSFNQYIRSWDVSNVKTMNGMFESSNFNQPLGGWDVSSVTDMNYMFSEASVFNQSLDLWNTPSLARMGGIFLDAKSFNQPLNNWDVSSVNDMSFMFEGAYSFNQPLNNWNTSSVTHMTGMFAGADSFNRSISSWNISSVKTMNGMFQGETIPTAYYSDMLMSWILLPLQSYVWFDAGNSTITQQASEARNYLIHSLKWKITDGVKDGAITNRQLENIGILLILSGTILMTIITIRKQIRRV